jgi:hypothetical protein
LDVVETGAAASVAAVLGIGAMVVPADEMKPVAVYVEFSWKIPPRKVEVVELDAGPEDVVEVAVVDDDTAAEDVVWVVEVVLVVGCCVEVGVEEVVGAAEVVGFFDEEGALPVEPSVLKTTMLALDPLGTVTTQKSAPPTPSVETGLFTPFIPSVEGSIEHGRPLQPPPGHSILTPKDGLVLDSPQPVKIGFHAILTKV